jgi:DNA adenine methylase
MLLIDNINIPMASPLRYPGGKTRACKILEQCMTEKIEIDMNSPIISPFFGGGSFEIYLNSHYGMSIIANDLFTPVISFWSSLKDHKIELTQEIKKLHPLDKQTFVSIRENIMNEENKITQGAMFFALNRCSFSGSTLSGGYSTESALKRFTKSSIDRLSNIDLRRFSFYNLNFTDFLIEVDEKQIDNRVLFLDPPYDITSKLYGNKGDLQVEFDHDALANVLAKKQKWMLCYNSSKSVKERYKTNIIMEPEWAYGMNASKKSDELLIFG